MNKKAILFSFLFILLAQAVSFAQEIKFISWNIKDFGQSRDDDEIKMIAHVIRDADIVAIQEVVGMHSGSSAQKLLTSSKPAPVQM